MKVNNKIFNYCPNCKSDKIVLSETKKLLCSDCNFEYYHNVATAVAVIIENGKTILLTRRNINPKKGTLDLPGGFVEANESVEDAAKRELYEELGITIDTKDLKYLFSLPNEYPYKNTLYRTCDMIYKINYSGQSISFDKKEIEECVWLNKDEINLQEVGLSSIKIALKKYAPHL